MAEFLIANKLLFQDIIKQNELTCKLTCEM